MQENIKDIKQESYHVDGTKEDTEDANNPQDILSSLKKLNESAWRINNFSFQMKYFVCNDNFT